jgi:hypothetical protein
MAITNTWNVVQMDAYPEYEGETDVVFTVHWTIKRPPTAHTQAAYTVRSASRSIPMRPSHHMPHSLKRRSLAGFKMHLAKSKLRPMKLMWRSRSAIKSILLL